MAERPSVSELLAERYGDTPILKAYDTKPSWASHVVSFIDETVKGESPHRHIPFGCARDADIVAEALRSAGHREANVLVVTDDRNSYPSEEDARDRRFDDQWFEFSQERYS